ncbi:hypothetical protein PRUPE_2G168300 [Prunus persica]|uniref:Uncharacterized protein n=1 Tax=Prunus persica TaxID=3760 RepID=A0A251QGV8_PRUPE|nr:uncharacterized protein LOC18786171 isoform X2 [Prunus persica]ONI23071.1 hypothetical protein PRUPE_2G168300 [Prunus persica]
MALNERQGSESGHDPEELEVLECEVKEMAEKILEYRATLPDQLKNTFASILAVQQPVFLNGSDPGTSGAPNSGQVASNKGALLADGDQTSEKLRLFRDKLSSNFAALPILLKRMTECISKIDNLDSENIIIHPAFKKKRTS